MPWKAGYTITDERTVERVEWPDGYRAAALVTVDLAARSGPEGIGDAELAAEDAEFGLAVALPRLLDLFDRYGVRATFAVPAVTAEARPEAVRTVAARGHEVAAHGLRHEDVSGLAPGEEARRLQQTIEALTRTIATRPAGWFTLPRQQDRYPGGQISRRTMDLLIDAGFEYMGNGMADDVPHYWITDFGSRRHILTLPYYYHFDDQFFLMFPPPGEGSGLHRPRALRENWRAELAATRALGRCFTMTLHPGLIGWGEGLGLLEETLAAMRGGEPVWTPTGLACARWWATRYPATTTLRLAPSIWQDHPGSLS
jgi:peptidoglycan/xylan/chitin deacetylase (PgdA/CDA1 family)